MRWLARVVVATVCFGGLVPAACAADEEEPVQLPPILVTPPDDPLLHSERHLRQLQENLPGKRATWVAPEIVRPTDGKDSAWVRPSDPVGALIWDVRQINNRSGQQP